MTTLYYRCIFIVIIYVSLLSIVTLWRFNGVLCRSICGAGEVVALAAPARRCPLTPGRGNGAMVRAGGATGTIKIDFKSVFASHILTYSFALY